MTPDWIVSEVIPTSDALSYGRNAYYTLHVRGLNLSTGEPFSWSVRGVADPRYDLTHAVIDPRAIPFLGREVAP